jgi:hypothetical protein
MFVGLPLSSSVSVDLSSSVRTASGSTTLRSAFDASARIADAAASPSRVSRARRRASCFGLLGALLRLLELGRVRGLELVELLLRLAQLRDLVVARALLAVAREALLHDAIEVGLRELLLGGVSCCIAFGFLARLLLLRVSSPPRMIGMSRPR